MIYWILKNIIVGPIVKLIFRPWITGEEHIPKEGPAILVSNHLSFIDSIFLPLMVKRRIFFLAKSEYFTGKGIKGFFVKLFFTSTGQLPIDRSGGKASEDALNTGLEVLNNDDLLGIYPEGTRSPNGVMYRGRTGVARMILETNVPVIPVAMIDTEKAMPIGSKLPKVRRIGVVIGEPIDFSRYQGLAGNRFVLRSVTDEIIYEMNKLSGQEYRDVYASTVRAKKNVAPEPAVVASGE